MFYACKSCGHKLHVNVIQKVLDEHNGRCPMCNANSGFFIPPVIGIGDKEYDMGDANAFEQFCKDIDELEKGKKS